METKKDDGLIIKETKEGIVTDLTYLKRASLVDQIKEIKLHTFDIMEISDGQKILDMGCGTGDDALAISKMVGKSGKIVGIDVNSEAIQTAQGKVSPENSNIEFICQSGEELKFKDNYFDSCRSDRVFQHLKNNSRALSEMVRVTKPGGKIVIMDPDWGTSMINSSNKKVTRTILNTLTDSMQNGWMGRNLFTLFKKQNLKNVAAEPIVFNSYDFKTAKYLFMLDNMIEKATTNNEITEGEAKEWLQELEEKDKQGLFYAGMVGFIVTGTK